MKYYVAKRRLILDKERNAIEQGKRVEGLTEADVKRLLAMRAIAEVEIPDPAVWADTSKANAQVTEETAQDKNTKKAKGK